MLVSQTVARLSLGMNNTCRRGCASLSPLSQPEHSAVRREGHKSCPGLGVPVGCPDTSVELRLPAPGGRDGSRRCRGPGAPPRPAAGLCAHRERGCAFTVCVHLSAYGETTIFSLPAERVWLYVLHIVSFSTLVGNWCLRGAPFIIIITIIIYFLGTSCLYSRALSSFARCTSWPRRILCTPVPVCTALYDLAGSTTEAPCVTISISPRFWRRAAFRNFRTAASGRQRLQRAIQQLSALSETPPRDVKK